MSLKCCNVIIVHFSTYAKECRAKNHKGKVQFLRTLTQTLLLEGRNCHQLNPAMLSLLVESLCRDFAEQSSPRPLGSGALWRRHRLQRRLGRILVITCATAALLDCAVIGGTAAAFTGAFPLCPISRHQPRTRCHHSPTHLVTHSPCSCLAWVHCACTYPPNQFRICINNRLHVWRYSRAFELIRSVS